MRGRLSSGVASGWRLLVFLFVFCLTGSTLSQAAGKGLPYSGHPSTKPRVLLPPREGKELPALKGRRIKATGPYEREYWYWYQRSLPLGGFPPGAEATARLQATTFRRTSRAAAAGGKLSSQGVALVNPTWQELGPRGLEQGYGPGIVSGRINTILLQKAQNRILIGSASGGIWKRSLSAGSIFDPKSDYAANLSFGALAADPNNPDVLYGGTGEAGVAVDAFTGNGLLRSNDGGETWQRVDDGTFSGQKISQVWVDPRNSSRILVGVLYGGLYQSVNGGVAWARIFNGSIMGFVVSPTNPDRILISNTDPGGSPAGDVRISTNSGASFTALNGPWQGNGTTVGRIELAFAPSDPNTVWALMGPPAFGTDNGRAGLYRSTDAGATFAKEVNFPAGKGGQSWYNNCIAVSPADPKTVIFGAVDLYRFTVGGAPVPITNWFLAPPLPFIHADQHVILFDPSDANTFYAGNDGGLWVTHNGGVSFQDMNAGLGTLQYYSGAVGTNNGLGSLFGGTQDNGTSHPKVGLTWEATLGGDGFQCAVDPQFDNIIYGTVQYSDYSMSVNGGASFFGLPPLPTLLTEGVPFFTPLAIDPSNGSRIYGGGQRVYRGISDRSSTVAWTPLSTNLLFPNDGVWRIAVAKTDGNVIYACGGSSFARTASGGDPWTVTSPPGGQFITGIVVHPTNANDVIISRSGFSGGHVLRSKDGGQTWANLENNLPNTPVNNLAIQVSGSRLDCYLASDTGVYYADLNASTITWSVVGSGLPNVVVNDVLLAEGGKRLVAVTHGRGMWAMLLGPSGLTASAVNTSTIQLNWTDNNSDETGFELERSTGGGPFLTVASPGPNATSYQDQNLKSNTLYTYRLRAVTPVGQTGYTNTADALTFPKAPTNLVVSVPSPPAGRTQLVLNWTDNSDKPSSFAIFRRLAGTLPFVQVGSILPGINTFQNSGLLPATTYEYRVYATIPTGATAPSNIASGTTLLAPPPTISALTVFVVSSSELTLRWTDNSTNEDGFRLERVRGTSFASGTDRVSRNLAPNTTTTTESGLAPGTAYTFRIFAYNSGGDSVPSPEAGSNTLPEAPAPPSGLAVTPLSASSLKLDWSDNSANETGFRIERAPAGGAFGTVETVPANITTFTNSGLSSNTTYRFRVRAINGVSVSAATSEVEGLTYPAAPTGLTATALSATQVRLNWTGTSTAPSAFKVYRKTTGSYSLLDTTEVGAAQYVDGTAAAATTYTYQVRATNASGDSSGSNEASATSLPAAPTAPSGLTVAVVSRSSLRLDWNDNSNNEEAFRIERASAGGAFRVVASVGAGVTSYPDTGLAANTTYSYRVKAANAGGESAPTEVKSATTLPELPAGATGLEVTTVSQTELRLTWSDVSSDETGFKIERSLNGTAFSQIAAVGANVTAYSNTGLTANTKYYYRVRATNAGGDSGYSDVANGTTLPNPPAAPGSLAVSVLTSRSLRLTWVDASNNETAFQVERSPNGTAFTVRETLPENATQFDDTGLSPETTYYYRVRALNAGGNSVPTSVVSGRTPADPPGAPTGLAATVLSASSVRLDWTDTGSTETGFRVDRSVNGGDFAEVRQAVANQTTVTDTGLAANTAYTYRVRAVNAGGSSTPSGLATGLTLPTASAQLTAVAVSASRINLTWIDTNPQPAGARIERAQGDSGFTERGTVAPGTLLFSDTGLAANTTYTYRVRAKNDNGVSDPSPTATATTLPAVPEAPSGLTTIVAGPGAIRLQWQDHSDNETGFKVERSIGGEGFGPIATVGAGVTTYLDSGLQPSREYVYRVRAYNAGGDSAYSESARATTAPPAPGAPTELAVTTGARGKLELSWRDNSTTESGFQVERSTDGTAYAVVGTAAENATRYSDSGLPGGAKFYYRVRAINAGGNSGYSNVAQGTTLPEAPSAPTGLTGVPSVASVRLTWTDTSSNEEGFIIERRGPGSDAFAERFRLAANRTEYSESGLVAGTTYTYRVRAFNGGGISEPAEAQVSTLTGLLSFTLKKSSVKGTNQVEGMVTLTGPAPSAGVVVTLASNSEFVQVPASVQVRAGKSTVTFPVKTKRVRAEVKATLTARYGGQAVMAPLTVTP